MKSSFFLILIYFNLISFIYGNISPWLATLETCQTLSLEDCIDFTYLVAYQYFGNFYAPTRKNSLLEDYYYNRTSLISFLTNKYQYKTYLEIGCDLNQTFGLINNLYNVAICVDPEKGGTLRMTSDDFFAQNKQKFDIIFIDGLHVASQVLKLLFSHLFIFIIVI